MDTRLSTSACLKTYFKSYRMFCDVRYGVIRDLADQGGRLRSSAVHSIATRNVVWQRNVAKCQSCRSLHRRKAKSLSVGRTIAKRMIETLVEKASWLYEQERRPIFLINSVSPLEMYIRRWLRWTRRSLTSPGVLARWAGIISPGRTFSRFRPALCSAAHSRDRRSRP